MRTRVCVWGGILTCKAVLQGTEISQCPSHQQEGIRSEVTSSGRQYLHELINELIPSLRILKKSQSV